MAEKRIPLTLIELFKQVTQHNETIFSHIALTGDKSFGKYVPEWNKYFETRADRGYMLLFGVHLNFKGACLDNLIAPYLHLYGANLDNASLREAVLDNAILCGANLSSANLYKTHLADANLLMAKLSEANLEWTCLSRANLKNAGFYDTTLENATLNRTNLSNAKFNGARIHKTNLVGADLDGTEFDEAVIWDTNLEEVKNLEKAIFSRTSIISCDLDKNTHLYQVSLIKGSGDIVTFYAEKNRVWCRGFMGTLREFEERVKIKSLGETTLDRKEYQEYQNAITFFRSLRREIRKSKEK